MSDVEVDVRDPEVLRSVLAELSEGRLEWTSPSGVAVLQRIERMARWAMGRTPVVVSDPHLVSSTVSHVWERLSTGQARFVVQADRPDRLLRSMVARTLVQVARAVAVCKAEPTATNRATPTGEVPTRLGDDTVVLEAEGFEPVSSPVVEELSRSLWRAVAEASMHSGCGIGIAQACAGRATDALRYVVDEVSACGIAFAHRRLSRDEQLGALLPWWSARALVWAVTGTSSGQGSWEAARVSVFARLYEARRGGDRRSIVEIAPEWGTVLARVTAAFRTDLAPPEFSAWVGTEEQMPLPGLAVVM